MGILTRFSNVLRAEGHGVIDRIEDRASLIRAQLRDTEDALADEQDQLGQRRQQARTLAQHIDRSQSRLADLDRDINLALGQDQADLARYSVSRYLPLKRQLDELREQRQVLSQQISADEERLRHQQDSLASLRQRADEALRHSADHAADAAPAAAEVSDEEIELELLRRRQGGGS